MHNRRRSLPTKLSTFIDCFQLHSYSTKCRDLRTKANIQLTVQTFSSEWLAKSQHKLTCDKNNYEDSVSNYIMCSTCSEWLGSGQSSSSSHMRVINHNWSATKQCLHPQSVAEISRHSVLSGDRIWQCETSYGSRHKDTDQCLIVAISFCRHRSVPVPCENGSAETTVAKGGRNPVAGLWGHTLGRNWPPDPTSSYASIDFWCQLVAKCKSSHNSFLDVSRSNGGLRISGWIGQLSCLTIFSTSLSSVQCIHTKKYWKTQHTQG